MEVPEEIRGVLIICGIVMFLSACLIVKVLKALDDEDESWNDN